MGLGYSPAKRTTNSNPVSHTECRPVRAPAQGRQREVQANPPPKEKDRTNSTAGGEPPAQPRARARRKKQNEGGGARDGHTTRLPRTDSTRGGQTPQPGNTKRDTHGAPRKNIGGPPSQSGDTQPRAAAHWRKGHPGHAGRHPTGERGGHREKEEKKIDATQTKMKGRRRPRGPVPVQATAGTTKSRHYTAQNHTPPPAARRKGRGGTNPTHGDPRTTPRHRQPDQRVAGNIKGARKRPHAPTPKPEIAECRKNANPHTHATNPSQDRRSTAQTRNQAVRPKPQPGVAQ